MDTLQITAQEAIRNAYKALQDGDKQAARRWAEQAASLGPELEEPWLVLAAVAAPRASVAYLEKALRINPHSLTARKGMDWAQSRLRQQGAPRSPTPSLPTPRPQRPRRIAFYASLAVLACLAIAVSFWTGAIPVRAFLVQPTQANWGGSEILKPTYTPTPSPTPSPTLTPSPTATPLPSLTPLPPIQASPIPQEAAYPGNKSILVDISEQRLYAYEGDVLVFSFIASTGIGNSTRVGSFSVLDK
ncbi:MAG: L,D-transpeptidase, partial [Chloroflexi bacterium]|nr:L,D-transpeptidase [Chloroflexota bacterium]